MKGNDGLRRSRTSPLPSRLLVAGDAPPAPGLQRPGELVVAPSVLGIDRVLDSLSRRGVDQALAGWLCLVRVVSRHAAHPTPSPRQTSGRFADHTISTCAPHGAAAGQTSEPFSVRR